MEVGGREGEYVSLDEEAWEDFMESRFKRLSVTVDPVAEEKNASEEAGDDEETPSIDADQGKEGSGTDGVGESSSTLQVSSKIRDDAGDAKRVRILVGGRVDRSEVVSTDNPVSSTETPVASTENLEEKEGKEETSGMVVATADLVGNGGVSGTERGGGGEGKRAMIKEETGSGGGGDDGDLLISPPEPEEDLPNKGEVVVAEKSVLTAGATSFKTTGELAEGEPGLISTVGGSDRSDSGDGGDGDDREVSAVIREGNAAALAGGKGGGVDGDASIEAKMAALKGKLEFVASGGDQTENSAAAAIGENTGAGVGTVPAEEQEGFFTGKGHEGDVLAGEQKGAFSGRGQEDNIPGVVGEVNGAGSGWAVDEDEEEDNGFSGTASSRRGAGAGDVSSDVCVVEGKEVDSDDGGTAGEQKGSGGGRGGRFFCLCRCRCYWL